MTDKAKRLIAAGLGAVLIALTPGPGTYRAFAGTLEGSGAPRVEPVPTPVAPAPGLAAPADGLHAGAPAGVETGGVPSAIVGSQDAAASSSEAAASVSGAAAQTAPASGPAGQAAAAPSPAEAVAKALDSRALYEAHRLYLQVMASLGGRLSSLRPAGSRLTQATLADAADARGVLSDLDQTLLRSNAAFDNQLSPEVVSAIQAVHAAGKTIDIVSDRPESVFKSLESLPVETRAGMYVAVDMGGRIYRYDAGGEPVLVRKAKEMSTAQKTLLGAVGRSVMKKGLAPVLDESFRPYNYTIRFKVGTRLEQVQSVARGLESELRRLGVDLPVRAKMADHPTNPPYVSVSIITKGKAARWLSRVRGLKPHQVLVLGDAMFSPKLGVGNAADAQMQDGVPGARLLAVGGTGDPRRRRLTVLGVDGPQAATQALLAVASKPAPPRFGWLRTRLHETGLWLRSVSHYFLAVNLENWREYKEKLGASEVASSGNGPVDDPRGLFVDSRMIGMVGGPVIVGSRNGSDRYIVSQAQSLYDRYFPGEQQASGAFRAFVERTRLFNPRKNPSNFRKHIRKGLIAASLMLPAQLRPHFQTLMPPDNATEAEAFQGERAQAVLRSFAAVVRQAVSEEEPDASGRVVGIILMGSFPAGSATPTSDFDLHVMTADGTSAAVKPFLERLERRWRAHPESKDHPVNGADFGFLPSRELLLRIHRDPFLIISDDAGLERQLSPRANVAFTRPDAATPAQLLQWWFYNRLLRAATYLDDVRTLDLGKLRLVAALTGLSLTPMTPPRAVRVDVTLPDKIAEAAPREYSLDELTAILAERMRTTGIKAIISDYDGTVQDKTPDDKAVVASDELVAALDRLRAAGISFNVSTNHFFHADNANAMTYLLGGRLSPETRAGMMFSVMSGARVYEYGRDGARPEQPAWKETEFDAAEHARLRPVFEETAAKLGLERRDYSLSFVMERTVLEFDSAHDARLVPLFEASAAEAGIKTGEYAVSRESGRTRIQFSDPKKQWRFADLFDEGAEKLGIRSDDFRIADEPSRALFEVRAKDRFKDEGALYEALARANEDRGLGYLVQLKAMPTMRHVPYVQYFKAHKGTGARRIVELLKARGVIKDESEVLILGDDFKPEGNDLYMAQTLPRALAISVSKTHDASQPNVLQASARGAATIRELLRRLAAMAKQPK